MSQRSHIAQSGSRAISECSAAWSEPSSRGISLEALEHPRLGQEPDGLGLELGLRQLERDELEALLGLDRALLVADHLVGDDDAAEGELDAEPPVGAARLDDRGRRLGLRLRVVVAGERLDQGGPRLEVERPHPVALAEVEVDRAVVHGREGALLLGDPEDGAARALDDRERLGAGRAKGDARRRVVAAGPDVARLRVLQLGQHGRALEGRVAEHLAVAVVQRRLEGGGADVAVEHARILVVEDRRFDSPAEQRPGLAHEVLIERVLAGDQHRQARARDGRRGPTAAAARRPFRGSRLRSRSRAGRRRSRARARSSR